LPPDTAGLLGIGTIADPLRQLPAAFDDSVIAITVWFNGDKSSVGRHLCIDSCTFATTGLWKWVGYNSGTRDFSPLWNGLPQQPHISGSGYCFQVFDTSSGIVDPQPTVDTASIFSIVQSDIDGDNFADFVFTGGDVGDSLMITYGRSDGLLDPHYSYGPFPKAALDVGFIDGDTLLDILARSETGIKVFRNAGSRNFADLGTTSSAGSATPGIALGYFDSDAVLDYVATPDLLAFGNGSGGFPGTATAPFTAIAVGAADFNRDFYDDVVAVVGDSAKIYLNNGSASFSRSAAVKLSHRPFDVATVFAGYDFDKDGLADFCVLTGKQDSLTALGLAHIILTNSSGGILASDTFTIAGLARSGAICDIDRDKDLDLAIINSSNNRLEVFMGNGGGDFPDSTSAQLTIGMQNLLALATGDLNRDGNPDFVSGGDSTAIIIATNGLPPTSILPDEMVVTGYGGYDLTVVNPQQFLISRHVQGVAGAAWWQTDVNHDSVRDVRTYDYNLQDGEYQFVIRPTPLVPPGSAFTMDIRVDGSHQIKSYNNYVGPFAGRLNPDDASAVDSMTFYYKVESTPSMNPPNGERTQSTRQPAFEWARLLDSTVGSYQFQLDDDYYFVSPLRDTSLSTPRYVVPIPLDTGKVYYWRVRTGVGSWSRTMAAYIGAGCCIGYTGNVNKSAGENPDLSDLSLLISYLTVTPKPTLPCLFEANINGTGAAPDLSDLSLLIAYLTVTPKPTLPNCL
jgi:hypothetical protein